MSHFRETMAAILLSSDLNKRKGCLLYNYEKEVDTGNSSDVEILDIPTNPKKRKLLHVLDDRWKGIRVTPSSYIILVVELPNTNNWTN
jgi:hypothetical protein